MTAAADDQANENTCLDYGRSFITNKASFNAVRFWIESRTTLHDEATDKTLVYYQCG